MDRQIKEATERIEQLNAQIATLGEADPTDASLPELYLERGKLHYRLGSHNNALNDILKVRRLDPGNTEAMQYEKIIRDIFEYHYVDYYNP